MTPYHDFLSILFSGLTGTIELRPVPAIPQLRDFVILENGYYDEAAVERYIGRSAALSVNAFFGVATRRVGARSGRANDCAALPALFVDCDYKHTGEQRVLEALADFPLPPSMIVSSGGGAHGYWLLDTPLNLDVFDNDDAGNARINPVGLVGATDIMRRLAAAIGVADESVSEPARVLRLPGTFNFKKEYGTPRSVTLDVCEPTRRYSLSEVCLHISDKAPDRPWRGNAGASLRPDGALSGAFCLPATIAPGDRHATLFALLRSQQIRGLSFEGAFASCVIENASRCEAPIDDDELERFLRRAWGTENRSQA